jgi:hypothetical protein
MPKYGNPHKTTKSKPKNGKGAAGAFVSGVVSVPKSAAKSVERIAKAIKRKPGLVKAIKRKPGLVKAIKRKPGLPIVKAGRRGATPAQKLGQRSTEAFTKADRAKGRAEEQQQEKRQARAMTKVMERVTMPPRFLKEYKLAKLIKPKGKPRKKGAKRNKQVMAADRHPM